MYEDLLNQLDNIESNIFELIQEKEATSLKLKTIDEKHRRVEADLESKEKKYSVEENCSREKLKQLEEQKLQMRFEYEERFKGFCEKLKRCNAKGKIYQKEAETARKQLRCKIFEILQLEDKRDEMLEDEKRRKEKADIANNKAKKYLEIIEDIKQEISVIRQSLGTIDTMKEKVVEVNTNLQKRSEALKENSEMLLAQIEDLKKENKALIKNDDGEKDLIIAQLELEFQCLTQKLNEAKEDKLSLETQLGYVNQSFLIDKIKDENPN